MKSISATATVAATLGLVATALAVTALDSSSSASPHARAAAEDTTLVFRLANKGLENKVIDIGVEGDSVGDRYIFSATLKSGGEIAGRLQHECTSLDKTYEGHLCAAAVIIEGGQITLATGGVGKPIPNVDGRGEVYAVTGGTGAYSGAEGELVVGDDGSTITITLLP